MLRKFFIAISILIIIVPLSFAQTGWNNDSTFATKVYDSGGIAYGGRAIVDTTDTLYSIPFSLQETTGEIETFLNVVQADSVGLTVTLQVQKYINRWTDYTTIFTPTEDAQYLARDTINYKDRTLLWRYAIIGGASNGESTKFDFDLTATRRGFR